MLRSANVPTHCIILLCALCRHKATTVYVYVCVVWLTKEIHKAIFCISVIILNHLATCCIIQFIVKTITTLTRVQSPLVESDLQTKLNQ